MQSSPTLAIQSDPLESIQKQFLAFQAKLEDSERQKALLANRVKSLEAEKSEIKPEMLAKMHQEGKDLKSKEAKLLEVHKTVKARFDKEKAEYEKSLGELNAIESQLSDIRDNDRNGAAVLYAKMDAFIETSRLKVEAELERAKTERTKAENERQKADDFLKAAEDKLKQVQEKGKSVFEKIAKAESAHEIKLADLTRTSESLEKKKENLEKNIDNLNKIFEKKKALVADLK